MIYILGKKQADERNQLESIKRGELWDGARAWSWVDFAEYRALRVNNDEGLTPEELAKCEAEPVDFDGYIPLRFRGIEKVTVTDYIESGYCDISAEINGLRKEFNGYYYDNDYWDNYTVLEWIAEQLKA